MKINFNQEFINKINTILNDLNNAQYYSLLMTDIAQKMRMKYEYKRDIIINLFNQMTKIDTGQYKSYDIRIFKEQKEDIKKLKGKSKLYKEDKFLIIFKSFKLNESVEKISDLTNSILDLNFKVWTDKKGNTEWRTLNQLLKPRAAWSWNLFSALIHKDAYDVIIKASKFEHFENKDSLSKMKELMKKLDCLLDDLFAKILEIFNNDLKFTKNYGEDKYHILLGCGYGILQYKKGNEASWDNINTLLDKRVKQENFRECYRCYFIRTGDVEHNTKLD